MTSVARRVLVLLCFCCGLMAVEKPALPSAQAVLGILDATPSIRALGIKDLTPIDHGFTGTIGSERVTVFACDPKFSTWAIAIQRATWSLPGGLDLKDALLVIVGGDTPCPVTQLPKAIHDRLAAAGSLPERFKAGITVAAQAQGHPGSALASVFAACGLGTSGCDLRGTLSLELLHGEKGDFDLAMHAATWVPPALHGGLKGKQLAFRLARTAEKLDFSGHAAVQVALPAALHVPPAGYAGTITVDDLKAAEPHITFRSDPGESLAWNDVCGQSWLDLALTGVQADFTGGTGTLTLHGTFDKHPVVVTCIEEDGALADIAVELPEALPLRHLPGLADLPGVRDLVLEDPRFSRHAVSGTLSFRGNAVEALLFADGAGHWNASLALRKPISLGALVGHDLGLLAKVSLPSTHLLLLPNGLSGPLASLPRPWREHLIAIGLPAVLPRALPKGIALHGNFDTAQLDAPLQAALGKLGISGAMHLTGSLDGVFGGKPAIDLRSVLPSAPKTVFAFLEPHPEAQFAFFITLAGAEVDLGFATSIVLNAGDEKPPMVFDVAYQVEARETGLELAVTGDMRGAWKDALGITGLVIADPRLSVGINATSGFDVGLAGTIRLGREQVAVAADTVVLPEAGFAPETVAFCGRLNRLPLADLIACADSLVVAKHGSSMQGGGLHGSPAELRDVTFAIVCPEAHLPPALADKLHLNGAGIALAGSLWIGNGELGAISGFTSEDGFALSGSLAPFHLGPVAIQNAEVDVQAGATVEPRFRIEGDIDLGRTREHCSIDVEPARYVINTVADIVSGVHVALRCESSKGLVLTPDNDFSFSGTLDTDFNAMAKNQIHHAIQGLRAVDARLAKAQQAVTEAQSSVDATKGDLTAARRSAQQRFDKVSAPITAAEHKVNKLKRREKALEDLADKMADKAKSAAKHLSFGSAARYAAREAAAKSELVGVYAARKTASAALAAVKKSIDVIPVDADPEVIVHAAKLKTEQAALLIAVEALKALRSTDQAMAKAAAALDHVMDAVQVTGITVSGSLRGLNTGGVQGRAPSLAITCSILGSKHVYIVDIGQGTRSFPDLIASAAEHAAQDSLAAVIK